MQVPSTTTQIPPNNGSSNSRSVGIGVGVAVAIIIIIVLVVISVLIVLLLIKINRGKKRYIVNGKCYNRINCVMALSTLAQLAIIQNRK